MTKPLANTFAYAEGVYLANPREKNGTEQPTGDLPPISLDPDLKYDSVPDQFHVRAGLTQRIWSKIGLAVSFGALFEGVPPRDLIGGSEGWRLPGRYVDLEPGFSLAYRHDYFPFSVPFAVYRHASQSVPFEDIGMRPPGLATIADYQIKLSYTHQF